MFIVSEKVKLGQSGLVEVGLHEERIHTFHK